ncbi:MAG: hypothetical protein EPN41_04040 [Candidimonas sp.]|nr:MAG: hypothetical protein EPN41_04040 [Candidimonas sp.]
MQPDLLQFHGNESAAFCRQFAHRYIRVFRIGAPDLSTPAEVLARCRQFDDAAAWLFDTHSSGYGGSGRAFDLELLSAVLRSPHTRPVILAGGLTAATVTSALEAIHPFAVDVSSGVEVSPGIKSGERVAAFIRAVRAYDNQNL